MCTCTAQYTVIMNPPVALPLQSTLSIVMKFQNMLHASSRSEREQSLDADPGYVQLATVLHHGVQRCFARTCCVLLHIVAYFGALLATPCRAHIDLNRNFPDPIHLPGKDLRQPTGREQPETLAMMKFILEHRWGCIDWVGCFGSLCTFGLVSFFS